MSVGEFSTFNRFQDTFSRGISGQRRLEQGRLWHEQVAKETTEAQCERPLQGTFVHKGWTFKLQGRLDQYFTASRERDVFIAREVKTTTQSLPLKERKVLEYFPHYCIQAATYAAILQNEDPDKQYKAELLLIAVNSGEKQPIELHGIQTELFENQLNAITRTLEIKKDKLTRLTKLPTRNPYDTLRDGQKETLHSLYEIPHDESLIFLEAPTGFGKTGLLLDYALGALKAGSIEHIIYTTGKSTGQISILNHLQKIIPKNSGLNYLQLRSHDEVAIESPLHTCNSPFDACTKTFLTRIQESGLNEENVFQSGKLTIESAQKIAAQHGLCPHTLLLHALKWANLWICDYNYVFSKTQRSLLNHYGHWDPRKTLLIIDEAHNLPGRVEQNFSEKVTIQEAINIYDFLENTEASSQALRAWQSWIDQLSSLQPSDKLSPKKEAALAKTLQSAVQLLGQNDLKNVPDAVTHALSKTCHLSALTKDTLNSYWASAPSYASLRMDCLSAAPSIANTLSHFHTCIFSSATLTPIEAFRESCGIPDNSGTIVQGQAPWKNNAYTVAIDSRIDTRYRSRAASYEETAKTIARLAEVAETPIVTFFPSYRYAKEIHMRLQVFAPWAHTTLQGRRKCSTEQAKDLETALKTSNILLLVLGCSFSESVDFMGQAIDTAVIVGPALPEVNQLQQARLERSLYLGRDAAFYRVYITPGMKKVHQALGRLVRAPGQKAKVLLHCQRFAEPVFKELLPRECKSATVLKTEADLEDWLAQP